MYRIENDLIGEVNIPSNAYYGVHTQRAIDNFQLTGIRLYNFPELIKAMGYIKWAAAEANYQLGLFDEDIRNAIVEACKKLIAGEHLDQFPSDMLQGGAGTSTNMNINEVVANIALEIMGHQKGEYQYCSPYDHVNLSQSTNDAYPSGVKLGILYYHQHLETALGELIASLQKKGQEFNHIMTMGRTHLQDAIPLRLGQEFEAYAATLQKEVESLRQDANQCLEINMGATAVGTGLNAVEGYSTRCTNILKDITGFEFRLADNLVEATSNAGSFSAYSAGMKKIAVKLSKMANDLRLLASGPRCGMHEINLPARQAGSSIMPGKVNPVIPEVVSQVCFKIIANDLAVTFAVEAGQLQLNVMEPLMTYSILESINLLTNALNCLRQNCIDGITANEEHCKNLVINSIGIVTALNPHIGYVNSTAIAQEALRTGESVYNLVLKQGILSVEEIEQILSPQNLLGIEP